MEMQKQPNTDRHAYQVTKAGVSCKLGWLGMFVKFGEIYF